MNFSTFSNCDFVELVREGEAKEFTNIMMSNLVEQ
jgi:hypothetical protein